MMRTIEELQGPRRFPVVGNALQVRPRELHVTAERWCRAYGPVFRFNLGPRPVVGVGDAGAINEILRQRPERFRRWSELTAVLVEMGIDGVFSAEGEDWRRQRRLAVTALNSNHLHRYFGVIRDANHRLYERLSAAARVGVPFAIDADFKLFTVEVTSALAFGHEDSAPSGADLRPEIDRVFAMIARRVSAPVPYWRRVRLPADRALDRSLALLRIAVSGFVEQARARILARPELRERPENFLEGMLAGQELEGRFNEAELFGNTLTMLLAGEDTTAATLAWTSWLLAQHPDVQSRLASEARDLLRDESVPIEPGAAARFEYGEAVLREAMRLKPASAVIFIEAVEDAVVADVRIPAGTRLLLLTRHAAVQEGSFARPDTFDPTRWLGTAAGTHDQRGFLAFGAGPRFCPGRNLAFLEAKAALAMLASNFELTLDPDAKPVTEEFTFTMAPRGLRVLLREREATKSAELAASFPR
jgi:cytochrome P450